MKDLPQRRLAKPNLKPANFTSSFYSGTWPSECHLSGKGFKWGLGTRQVATLTKGMAKKKTTEHVRRRRLEEKDPHQSPNEAAHFEVHVSVTIGSEGRPKAAWKEAGKSLRFASKANKKSHGVRVRPSCTPSFQVFHESSLNRRHLVARESGDRISMMACRKSRLQSHGHHIEDTTRQRHSSKWLNDNDSRQSRARINNVSQGEHAGIKWWCHKSKVHPWKQFASIRTWIYMQKVNSHATTLNNNIQKPTPNSNTEQHQWTTTLNNNRSQYLKSTSPLPSQTLVLPPRLPARTAGLACCSKKCLWCGLREPPLT